MAEELDILFYGSVEMANKYRELADELANLTCDNAEHQLMQTSKMYILKADALITVPQLGIDKERMCCNQFESKLINKYKEIVMRLY